MVVKPLGQMSTYEVMITVVMVTASEVGPEGFTVVGAEVIPLLPVPVAEIPEVLVVWVEVPVELGLEPEPV